MRETIGLVGLGLVGGALAENLLASGFDILGFARSAASRDTLVRRGGRAATSARAVGEAAERVILSLPDSPVVEQVILGEEGLLSGTPRARVILDTSTGDPERTEALAARLAGSGIQLVDAPISGSSQQIRERKGVFLIGGDQGAYARCRDLIETLAERHYHLGGPGAGARAKLATNLILGLNRLVLAEGLVFAERLGLDLDAFLALLKATPAYSCAVDVKGQKMVRGDFTPQSKVSQHHKDLRIILGYAERLGQDLPLARVHEGILARRMAVGEGDLDTSAVIRQLRAQSWEGGHAQ